MPKAFVTGGTGFLGHHIVKQLLNDSWDVTCLVRDKQKAGLLAKQGARLVQASLTDTEALSSVIPENATALFHVAADTSMWRGDKGRQWRTNVAGTRAVLSAARERKVETVIHTSSIAVYGHHKGIITENTPKIGATSWVGYVKSKYFAEMEALKAATNDQKVIILNPGHILGAGDTHNWASLFFLIRDGKIPGVPPGSGSFANVEEVAKAHIRAAREGKSGENYLLGGPKATFMDVFQTIGYLIDKPVPDRPTPAPLIKLVAHLANLKGRITGQQPDMTPEAADFVCSHDHIDSSKAIAALGYKEIPIKDSLKQCHDWLKQEGLL